MEREVDRSLPHFFPAFVALKHYEHAISRLQLASVPDVSPFSNAACYRADISMWIRDCFMRLVRHEHGTLHVRIGK